MRRHETFPDDCLGHIWKRGKGCYLAAWYTPSASADPDTHYDAFTTLAKAKQWVKGEREPFQQSNGVTIKIRGMRWSQTAEGSWRLDADTVSSWEEAAS